MGKRLPLKVIFECPTIEILSGELEKQENSNELTTIPKSSKNHTT